MATEQQAEQAEIGQMFSDETPTGNLEPAVQPEPTADAAVAPVTAPVADPNPAPVAAPVSDQQPTSPPVQPTAQPDPAAQAPVTQAASAPDVELRRTLNEREAELAELRAFKAQAEAAKANPGAAAPGDGGFIKNADELADFLTDPAKANAILERLSQRSTQDAVTIAATILAQHVETRLAVREAEKDFLAQNQDLAPFKNMLGSFSAQVKSEHPEWGQDDLGKIFEETGKRTRAFLQMQASQPASAGMSPAPSATPGFAPGTGTRRQPDNLSPEQKEMAAFFAE